MKRARLRRGGEPLAVALALFLLAGLGSAAQDEGPLRNQAFVPVDDAAREALTRGDALFADDPSAAADAWFEALADSSSGAAVPFGAADPSESRAFEGVEEAVLRRLRQPGAALAFRDRFGDLAVEQLGAGRGPEALLARVERRFPSTRPAYRAALTLGDRALARGAHAVAQTWYERAATHAALGAGSAEPVERRRALLSTLVVEPTFEPADGMTRALEPIALDDPRGPRPSSPSDLRGSGLRAGLAVVDPEQVAVQTASRVHLVDLERGAVSVLFEPAALLPAPLGTPPDLYPSIVPPAWALQPSAHGRRLLLVVGRRGALGTPSNALLCVDLPRPAGPELPAPFEQDGERAQVPGPLSRFGRSAAPTFRWALNASTRVAGEQPTALAVDLPLDAEFQPGPVQAAEWAVVALRTGGDELATRLLGLDPESGQPRWQGLLSIGSELAAPGLSLDFRQGLAGSATPLLRIGGAVFVGAQTGTGSLVDAVDGRLRWTVKNRRRADQARGWDGWRAAAAPDGDSLVWAPADGDHLYWLPAGPLPAGEHSPFLAPPAPIDADFGLGGVLRGPGGPRAVVTADVGPRRALAARGLADGERIEGLHLFPGEPLRNGLSVAPDRVLACSDRALYVFDPGRELLLVDRLALPRDQLYDTSRWARGGPVTRVGRFGLVLESGRLVRVALR